MPGSDGSDGDLDGILDSALADFDSDSGGAPAEPSVAPAPSASAQRPAGRAQDATGELPGAVAEDCAAIQDALEALNELGSGASVADGDGSSECGAEDMKMVEEFLKSLNSQFEKMGLPDGDGEAAEAGCGDAAGSAPRPVPSAAGVDSGPEPGANPHLPRGGPAQSEEDIDRMTRELEKLLNGGDKLAPSSLFDASAGVPGASAGAAPRGSGGAGNAGGGNEFENVIQSVVGELLSKDILSGPMKQMRDAYRTWLPTKQSELSVEDAARYKSQEEIVSRICAEYDKDDCSVGNVMDLLQKMQETGAPPPEVMAHLDSDEGSGSERGDGQGTNPSPLADLEKLGNCPVQ